MTELERWYSRLLYAYPAWYRRERGAEILDTLLAVAPHGRTRPSIRDSVALILAGLRVRAGQNRPLSTAANVRLAVLFGIALWLAVSHISGDLSFAYQGWLGWVPPHQLFLYSACTGQAGLAAVLAAWLAPRPAAAAIAVIAGVACAFPWQGVWWLLGEPALLVLLGMLALGKERLPRSWLWLFGFELAVQVLQNFADWAYHPLFVLYPVLAVLPWAILAAVVLWMVVDARPAIALGISAALVPAIPFVNYWYNTDFGPWSHFLPVLYGAILAFEACWRVRRQALL